MKGGGAKMPALEAVRELLTEDLRSLAQGSAPVLVARPEWSRALLRMLRLVSPSVARSGVSALLYGHIVAALGGLYSPDGAGDLQALIELIDEGGGG